MARRYLCNAAGSGKPGGGGGADCLRVKQLLECYAKAEAGPSCGSDDARYLTVLSKRMASQLKTAQGDAKEALQVAADPPPPLAAREWQVSHPSCVPRAKILSACDMDFFISARQETPLRSHGVRKIEKSTHISLYCCH